MNFVRHRLVLAALLTVSAVASHAVRQSSVSEPIEPSTRPPAARKLLQRPAVKAGVLIVAGGLSGVIAKSATAPLERAKLLGQAGRVGTPMQLMGEVVRAEGWAGLWRGNPANILRYAALSQPLCSGRTHRRMSTHPPPPVRSSQLSASSRTRGSC
jgi:hypothetical protein